jgi:hypothetical protein
MPRIMPDERYFSMPSTEVGAEGDRRGVADHGYEIPMSPRLGPQNAEAILGIVEGDALHESRQNFLR